MRNGVALRLVLLYVGLEFVIGPRLSLLGWLHIAQPPTWVRIPALSILALMLVVMVAGARLSDVGLRKWREWPRSQKLGFLLLVVVTNAIFCLVFASRLRIVAADPLLSTHVWTVIFPYFIWGFYQELVYRGILQTALTQRVKQGLAILVSNLLFTFGPLHYYYWTHPSTALASFAITFCTGLVFAVVFALSKNLWLVGILHGLGNVYTDAIWAP